MKKLHKYLITSFVGPFVAVLFVVVFALSMQFLWVYVDELVGKGLGIGVILEFMGWAACTLLPMALPLATLLASIMTMGNFGERNELLAMKAAGISLTRIIRPLIIVSAFISIGAFFAGNNLVPHAYNKIYTLRADIGRTKEEIKIPTGTFYDGIEGYILRVSSRNKKTDMMRDILLYDHTGNDGNTNVTVADSGKISITEDKKNLIFELFNGCSYQEDNRINYRDTSIELSRSAFSHQTLIVPLEDYSFSRSEEDSFGDQVMSRGLKLLRQDRDTLTRQLDSVYLVQYRRFMTGCALGYLSQLDTSVCHHEYADSFQLDSLNTKFTAEREQTFVQQAKENVETAVGMVENNGREALSFIVPLRNINVESYRKFTFALACLLFFFIGAPLGAIIRKGGLGTPVVVSVLFFLIYYIVDMIGKKLAKNGAVPPLLGTAVATVVLIPIGWFLTRKSTQDSAIFNLDSYKEALFTINRKVSKAYHRTMNHFRKGGAKIRIVYMGTPEFAVAPLDAIIKAGYEVAVVVTVADKPSGRGLEMNESAVKKYAVANNIPVLQPVKLKDPEFLAQLASYQANLFVVVAFRMLPKEVWSMPALGTFNLHASLLPQYRGAAPINWVLINGERVTGVTTFMIDEEIDTGKILFQESCTIEDYDDAGTLHDKLMKMGSALVVKTVDTIENRQIKPYEQETMSRTLKSAPKITKETCKIDWMKDAYEINQLIKGLSPYPAAFSGLEKDGVVTTVKIFDAYVVRKVAYFPPGSVLSDGKTYLDVKCGHQLLRITELQLAGKKRMDIKTFLLGFRNPEDYRFV